MPPARSDYWLKPSVIDRLRLAPFFAVHSMTFDWRLAEALAIQKQYGIDASRWVAERLGALALAGETEGVERFKAIAARLDDLMSATRQ